MSSPLEAQGVTDPQVAKAKHEVEMAREALAQRLGVASESGRHMIKEAMHNARPVLIGVAGLAAVGLAYGIARLARMPGRSRWVAPRQPSLLSNMLRSALVSAAATLAGRMMQRIPLEAGGVPPIAVVERDPLRTTLR